MAEYKIENTSRTNLAGKQGSFEVESAAIDTPSDIKENVYDFPNASLYFSYYKKQPHLKKAIDAFANWSVGRGVSTDSKTKAKIDAFRGWGEDNFLNIMWNIIVQRKVFGDAFAEIIRNERDEIINLKPLYPGNMRIITNKKGFIVRYEQKNRKSILKFQPSEIFHSSNDRVADEIHGTSVIECVRWIVDAIEEAMRDYRIVLHRNVVPVRIIEVDTDNKEKRDALISEYEDAIKKGEVLVIPKGTVEFKDTSIQIQDPISWITHLENLFYLAVGVPRVVLGGSSQSTEASAKVDYLTFEEVYNREHNELETDLWNQLGIKIKFNKPASLQTPLQTSEAANTGQLNFQPKDVSLGLPKE